MNDLDLWKKLKAELEQAGQQGTITYACACEKIRELTIQKRVTARLALITVNQ
jgi:hypothetical protein